jgi:hypothetical protein
MGLCEAADLSRRLADVLRESAPLDSLADYDTRFRAPWRQLLAIDGGLTPSADAAPWARTHCSKILPCIPATEDDLIALAAQIGLAAAPPAES